MRTGNGGYRRTHLSALAQRVEVGEKAVRIMWSRSELLRPLVDASSAKPAGFGMPSYVPKWRPIKLHESAQYPRRPNPASHRASHFCNLLISLAPIRESAASVPEFPPQR